ncbi:MFS-type transporter SLC18B1 [Trichoplax sp. H2]|nr:MFS-type transporter SLC18B1 [Trichoplax sp. H2]|eukprot:RDD42093.1 MFS-type transporter SLC18B1 [Trichoplax sp. H2]
MEDTAQTQVSTISRRIKIISIIILSCTYVVTGSVYAVIAPFFPTLAEERNVTNFEIGIIFAVYPLVKLIVSPIIGAFLPHIGVKYALWAGMMIDGGCTMAFGFLPEILDHNTFVAFCIVVRGIEGMGAAAYQTAGFSFASAVFKDSVATTLGFLEIATSLGFMAGPPVGGLLYKAGGFRLPFIVLASLMIVAGICIAYFLPSVSHESKISTTGLMKRLITLPRVLIICIGVALHITSFSYLDPTLSIHIEPFKLSHPQVGLIFLIIPAAYGLCAPVVGYVSDRIGFRIFIVLGNAILGVSLLFLGPAPFIPVKLTLTQTILSNIGMGAGVAVALIPSYPDVLEAAKSSRYCRGREDFATNSVTSGLYSAFISLGQIIGPIVGGTFTSASDVDFDWISTIIGFIAFGQMGLVILLTIVEKMVDSEVPSSEFGSGKTINGIKADKNLYNTKPNESSPLLT